MEELKVIMEALAKMGEGAQMAFIVWCVKDFAIYLLVPITFWILGGIITPKIIRLINDIDREIEKEG